MKHNTFKCIRAARYIKIVEIPQMCILQCFAITMIYTSKSYVCKFWINADSKEACEKRVFYYNFNWFCKSESLASYHISQFSSIPCSPNVMCMLQISMTYTRKNAVLFSTQHWVRKLCWVVLTHCWVKC